MPTELEEIAAAADEAADENRQVARRARAMQRRRDRGWGWSRILASETPPGLLPLLRRAARRTADAAGRFAALVAHGLSAEGLSRRRIATHIGVSHQRVTAMLRAGSRARAPRGE